MPLSASDGGADDVKQMRIQLMVAVGTVGAAQKVKKKKKKKKKKTITEFEQQRCAEDPSAENQAALTTAQRKVEALKERIRDAGSADVQITISKLNKIITIIIITYLSSVRWQCQRLPLRRAITVALCV